MKKEILQGSSKTMGIEDLSVREFLDQTASSAPVPGGGSIAAVTAASAAALIEMVINLTIDKKGYEEVQGRMISMKSQLPSLRKLYLQAADADATAFSSLMETLRRPKEEEGRAEAAEVPLTLGQDIFPLLTMARQVVEHGNIWAVTDGVIAAMNARAAMRAAFYSVRVNLQSINDGAYVYRTLSIISDFESRADGQERLIESLYKKRQ